jgi:hypothetical protein
MGATDASGWSDDIVPGSPAAVYIEDNTFTNNGVSGNPAYFWGNSSVQAYYGARTVFRHNHLIMSQIDQHGTPGMIGVRWWEIYENLFDTDVPNASQCCFVSLRAGSGVVFNNHHVGANLNGNSIDLYEEDTGYPALYQIGRGKNQVLDPAYVWGNDAFFSVGSQTPAMVQVSRDYYLAQKPKYTPFTYPYPLTASGMPDPGVTGVKRSAPNSANKTCARNASYQLAMYSSRSDIRKIDGRSESPATRIRLYDIQGRQNPVIRALTLYIAKRTAYAAP